MRFAIALAALLLAGPARAADFLTTSDLRSYCMSQNATSQLVWKYYLQGIVDVTIMAGIIHEGLETRKDRESSATMAVCYGSDDTVTADAIQQIFLNWANQLPKEWSRPAGFAAVAALRETWPCL
jgi:Rap1a immunity proteins